MLYITEVNSTLSILTGLLEILTYIGSLSIPYASVFLNFLFKLPLMYFLNTHPWFDLTSALLIQISFQQLIILGAILLIFYF